MHSLKDRIEMSKKEFESSLSSVVTLKELDTIRITFSGKKGIVSDLFHEMKQASVEEKRECGPLLNELKNSVGDKINEAKIRIIEEQSKAAQLKKQNFDVSAYDPLLRKGSLHPYSQFIEECQNIFMSMGYEVLHGFDVDREIETDKYNFEYLNFPPDHPARDMYDTLWLNAANYLLRPQTSPVQIRAMQTRDLPIAAVIPGRTYRYESVDASHDVMFMQCEGFLIGKNITMSHLFATAQTLLKTLFKKDDLDIRIRPGYFPFVEPGVEIDMRCPFCKTGCNVCGRTTWFEVFPGGLIHPNVLRAGGIDPEKNSGFAFGFGLTRLVMLKYGINDIRLLHSGKMKFLEQF